MTKSTHRSVSPVAFADRVYCLRRKVPVRADTAAYGAHATLTVPAPTRPGQFEFRYLF